MNKVEAFRLDIGVCNADLDIKHEQNQGQLDRTPHLHICFCMPAGAVPRRLLQLHGHRRWHARLRHRLSCSPNQPPLLLLPAPLCLPARATHAFPHAPLQGPDTSSSHKPRLLARSVPPLVESTAVYISRQNPDPPTALQLRREGCMGPPPGLSDRISYTCSCMPPPAWHSAMHGHSTAKVTHGGCMADLSATRKSSHRSIGD